MGSFDRIYSRLPVWAQNIAVSAYGVYWYNLRFGGGYAAFERAYRSRNRFTNEEWQRFQKHVLGKMLTAAAQAVPYYHQAWSKSQFQAAQAGELSALPLLGKQPIRDNPQAFIDPSIPGRKLTFFTSGSTGTPIAVVYTVAELRDSLAVREVRSANWAGVSFKLPRATFSGRIVEPDPNSTGPFYRYNAAERQAYFSAFHLRPNTAAAYIAALKRHNIQWMTGYAVSFYLLARLIIEQKLAVPPLRAVVTTSEKVTPEMRRVMEQAYSCKVYEEYSTVENALFASECEHGRLHVSPDVGIVEILRPDGSPCAPGEVGEVVTTCFMRRAQPFIRYRLGDLASWSSEPCTCGRSMPVIQEVVGRIEDVVIGPDGRQMVRFHGIFTDQPHIREGQIIQEAFDLIRVKVVASPGYSDADTANVVKRIQQRLGPDVRVIVEIVDQIPRTQAGKFKAVISNL